MLSLPRMGREEAAARLLDDDRKGIDDRSLRRIGGKIRSEDLMAAWERLRETAGEFGEQRIYASHKSIMFSRNACYFFVRPKKKVLEICFFLGRTLRNPLVRKTLPASKLKVAHLVHITHRDQVEPPLTDWLKEAFDSSERLSSASKKPKRLRYESRRHQ